MIFTLATTPRRFSRTVLASSLALALAGTALLAAPARAAGDPNAVVAKVDGVVITEREVSIATEDLGSSFAGMTDEQRRDAIIGLLIDIKIVAKAAEKAKLDQDEAFAKNLAYLRDKALMQAYLDKEAQSAVNDAAIKKVYDETVKDLKPEPEVRARHILVQDEATAKSVVERLKKGEDFAKVAKEASKDPGSAAEGGDLGFFSKEQMVPEFAEAAFKLEPGKVSDPVQSQFGWHVIRVDEKRNKPVPSLEQVKDQISLYLVRRAQQDQIKKLRDSAKVERSTPPATPATPGQAPAAGQTPKP